MTLLGLMDDGTNADMLTRNKKRPISDEKTIPCRHSAALAPLMVSLLVGGLVFGVSEESCPRGQVYLVTYSPQRTVEGID